MLELKINLADKFKLKLLEVIENINVEKLKIIFSNNLKIKDPEI